MQLSFEVDPLNVADTLPKMVDMWRVEVAHTLDDWGKAMVDIAFNLSPSDKIRNIDNKRKKGRRPESESFKHFWEFQTGFDGADPYLEVGNTDERMPYIVFETQGGALITPKEEDYLVFYWLAKKNWYTPPSVIKGATPGQPVHEWTIEEFNIDQHLADVVGKI